MEAWKKVDGFALYEVSDKGRVRSLPREITRTNPRWGRSEQTITWKGGILGGTIRYADNGKPDCVLVSLRRDGETHRERVHRLVLIAFVGDCPDGLEGCHNDGNPLNNGVKNLRWDTRKSNINDSVLHKTKRDPPVHVGERHPNSKLTEDAVADIRAQKYYRGLFTKISSQYSISIAHARRIWRGDGWAHV